MPSACLPAPILVGGIALPGPGLTLNVGRKIPSMAEHRPAQAGEDYREATVTSRKIKRRRLVGGKRPVLLVAGVPAPRRAGAET